MEKAKKSTEKLKKVNPIPEGFQTVTPFLMVNNASKFIDFVQNAFGGVVTYNMKSDDGKVMHATVKIGDSTVMVSDPTEKYGPVSSMLYLYVNDVDTVYQRALKANATPIRKPTDEFYGDRSAGVTDEWGNQWWIATHIEDVSDAEVKRRMKEYQPQEEEV